MMSARLLISSSLSYGQMRMALYGFAPGLTVASALLPRRLDGLYRVLLQCLFDRFGSVFP